MAKWGKTDYKQLKRVQEKLQRLAETDFDRVCRELSQELAQRLLAKTIRNTPVGDYTKDNEIKRYKRGNKKKGIRAGDIMYTKTGIARRERYKKVEFTTSSGKRVSFNANTSGQVGGTLRRGWTSMSEEEAKSGHGAPTADDIRNHIKVVGIQKSGHLYEITLENPVHYAPYVEHGHRKRGGKGWVPGRFMLTISERELEVDGPKIIEKRVMEALKEALDGN